MLEAIALFWSSLVSAVLAAAPGAAAIFDLSVSVETVLRNFCLSCVCGTCEYLAADAPARGSCNVGIACMRSARDRPRRDLWVHPPTPKRLTTP